MSIRIYTRQEDERTLEQALVSIAGGDARAARSIHKYYVLRLALSLSLRLPIHSDGSVTALSAKGEQGSEYRLKQLLDQGEPEGDQTDVVRLLLSVGHGVDLFTAPERDEHFKLLLEYHLHRGFEELRRIWTPNQELLELLADTLTDANALEIAPPLPIERLQTLLKELGLKVSVQGVHNGPRLTFYVLKLSHPNELSRLKLSVETIAVSLGFDARSIELEQGREAQTMELIVPRGPESWQTVGMAELNRWLDTPPAHMKLPTCPGVDRLGNPYWFDLTAAPHALVAGTTGSGKSVCVHAMLCSLLHASNRDKLELTLIDPKRVEFTPYAGVPQLRGERVPLCEADEITAELSELKMQMELRYRQFQDRGVRDLVEYNRAGNSLKYLVVVVDELADLIMTVPGVLEPLIYLAQKGRAAGIHLVLATQRPDAEILPGLLRSNVPTRIALAVQKSTESKIILDQVGAEVLLKPGDMLIKLGGDRPHRVHSVLIRNDDIAWVVSRLKGNRV